MIRQTIQSELARRQMSPHALAKLVEGKVVRSQVYAFLAGQKDISTQYLEPILDALGLTVTPKSRRRKADTRKAEKQI